MSESNVFSIQGGRKDPNRAGGSSGGDGGGNLETRIAILENDIKHLATKQDISNLQLEIQRTRNWVLGGLLAGLVVFAGLIFGAAQIVINAVRLFMD